MKVESTANKLNVVLACMKHNFHSRILPERFQLVTLPAQILLDDV